MNHKIESVRVTPIGLATGPIIELLSTDTEGDAMIWLTPEEALGVADLILTADEVTE